MLVFTKQGRCWHYELFRVVTKHSVCVLFQVAFIFFSSFGSFPLLPTPCRKLTSPHLSFTPSGPYYRRYPHTCDRFTADMVIHHRLGGEYERRIAGQCNSRYGFDISNHFTVSLFQALECIWPRAFFSHDSLRVARASISFRKPLYQLKLLVAAMNRLLLMCERDYYHLSFPPRLSVQNLCSLIIAMES